MENPRLQRLKSRLMAYNFTAHWTKGSSHNAPDALSRNPVSDPQSEDTLAEFDDQSNLAMSTSEIRAITTSESPTSPRLEEVQQLAAQDPEYQQLLSVILNGFPSHKQQLPDGCRHFWSIREHLSVDDGLTVYGCRLLIPTALRQKVLSDLHNSHQGLVRTKQRARLTVYWPGIDNEIENTILSCQLCQDHLPSNPKEPLTLKPKPQRPFQELAVDYCSYGGQQFLIIVDCFTDWPEIIPMGQNTQTHRLITALQQTFCRTAVPDVLWSDGGPQFTSNLFNNFTAQWGFKHQTSSPRYPQSNGKIEVTVKSMKKLLAASWDHRHLNEEKLCSSLLQYRNTPSRKDGLSPAQKLFGHPIQDTLPAHRRSFAPEWQKSTEEAEQQAIKTTEDTKSFYNAHAHSLPDINVGSHVALQNQMTKLWNIYGTVVAIGPHRRYHVKTNGGRVLVRNRRFLRHRTPASLLLCTPEHNAATIPSPPAPQVPGHLTETRHSQRPCKCPSRLIEDPSWP